MARNLERRYLELGGEIRYDARVAGILTQRTGGADRAAGVELADGTQEPAEIVISAADGHATIYDMLGGAYLDDELRAVYEREELPLFYPILFVGVGVAREFADEPQRISGLLFPVDEPIGAGAVHSRAARGAHLQLRPGHGARGQDGHHRHAGGGRPVLARAEGAGQAAVQRREGAHRRGRRARPRPPLPRAQGPGGDGRRRHAGHHRPLHRQLARQLRGLDADAGRTS